MPSQLDALKLHGRLALRDLLWLVSNKHVQGERPNVAIFGSRRSGTTLLMETIGSNRGIKSVGQPDSVFSGSAFDTTFLPVRDGGQLHHLNEEEKAKLRYFLETITSGAIHVNEPWRFWQRNFAWRSDRIVFKMTASHGSIDWLTEALGWQPIVLTRHPLAQSVSVQRLEQATGRWGSRAAALLRSAAYCADHLDARQEARAHDVWNGGNPLDRHVLGWILENLQLLRSLDARPEWHFVSYEALVLEPEAVIACIATNLDLADREVMLATLRRQSRTVRGLSATERQAAIRRHDRNAMLGSWRKRLADEDVARYQDMLDAFGIELYRAHEDAPRPLWSAPSDELPKPLRGGRDGSVRVSAAAAK